jgi:hypothetical protein
MMSYTQDQLMVKPFPECMEVDDRVVFLACYRAFFKNPAEKNLEVLIQLSRGPAFYAHTKCASIHVISYYKFSCDQL